MGSIQYISNKNNKITGVIVPIELWSELLRLRRKREGKA